MRADMHLHTFYSDGKVAPERVFEKAKDKGLDFICISDHDCVCPPEILENSSKKFGVKYVPAIEVSAYWNDVKVHTLCYNPDLENAGFKKFSEELKIGSYERAEAILKKLKGCGVELSFEDIESERAVSVTPIHAMHIARAGAKKGYAESEFEFFSRYLAWGKPAFCNVARPTPEYAAKVASSAGAVVSLAHPGRIDLDKNSLKQGILRLQSCGLRGIEAVYTAHTEIETAYFKEIAKDLKLFVTGGSDTHYENDGWHEMGIPEFHPDKSLLQALKICL